MSGRRELFSPLHLVDAAVLRQVEAILRRREPLHLQDACRDGHGGQVDPGVGLLEAHRVVDGGEGDPAVPWGRERDERSLLALSAAAHGRS